MNNETFYVFLDFDGTLYTQYDIEKQIKNGLKPLLSASYWPDDCNHESRDAFNFLIHTLEKNGYNVEVVIISQKRKDMQKCVEYMKKYGLYINKPLLKTPYEKGLRSDKIINFIYKHSGKYPKTKNTFKNIFYKDILKKEFTSNYVILDDDTSARYDSVQPLSKVFGPNNYIKVDGENESLKMSQVVEFLNLRQLKLKGTKLSR